MVGRVAMLWAAVALAVCAAPGVARAVPLQLVVTGVATEVTPAVSGVFSLNDPMSVVYTYDSDAAAEPSLILTQALYQGAISAVDFTIGSFVGAGIGGNVNVENDDPSFHDAVTFRGSGLVSGGTPTIGSHIPVAMGLRFFDASDAALGSLALPTTTADLAGFADRTWQLVFSPLPLAGFDPTAAVGGRVTSVEILVPEPAGGLLLAGGLALCAVARRRGANAVA
jgi:hypothetical protein